jgi:hypothetical protein
MDFTHADFTHIAHLDFAACESSFAILRAAPDRVILVLSIEKNGDIQVHLDSNETEKLAEALIAAVAFSRGRSA